MKTEGKRKSLITIFIVLIIIVLVAIFIIKFLDYDFEDITNTIGSTYISHLSEEDKMINEYSDINDELYSMYAFGIYGDNIVAIKNNFEIVYITQIDSQLEYDYLYNDAKMYLLEKNSGKILVINLNSQNYDIEETIMLNLAVTSFEIYDDDIYYISNNVLYKYSGELSEKILDNITSNSFIIKNEYIYIVKEEELLKIDISTLEQTTIAQNVEDIYYYNYYERNKLIYDINIDDENTFKGIYNYYTEETITSVNNKYYFIPYGENEYVYLTNDKLNVMLLNKSGSSKYLYKSEEEINNIVFLKSGEIVVYTENNCLKIDIDSGDTEELKETEIVYNVKYLK